jgi:hypothetical protein
MGMSGMTLVEKEKDWEIGPAKWTYFTNGIWNPMDTYPACEGMYELRHKERGDLGEERFSYSKWEDSEWKASDPRKSVARNCGIRSVWVQEGRFDGWREIQDDPPVD